MKILLLSTLLFFTLAMTVMYAQTAKAPARKKTTQKTATAIPAKSVSSGAARPAAVSPAKTVTAAPAANRSNSEKLPAPVKTAAPVPVQTTRPTPAPVSRTLSRRLATSNSGDYGFSKSDKLLNIGVGLSSYYFGNPIGLSYEVGITDDFSVGGQIDYNSGSYDDYYGYNSRYRYSAYYVGARGSYHFNRILRLSENKIDLYAGLGLGYQSFRWNDSYNGSGYGYDYGSGLFLNYFIGGKYYFTNKVGAFLELGYTGLSSSRVGLAVKF